MAHSGDARDKAPLLASLDISSVSRQRPVKIKKARDVISCIVQKTDAPNDVVTINSQSYCTKFIVMAEPKSVEKNEARLPTVLREIILNMFDDRLAYYIDNKHYIYRFDVNELIIVGKYVIGQVKLDSLSAIEINEVIASLHVRYVYDNNYFHAKKEIA